MANNYCQTSEFYPINQVQVAWLEELESLLRAYSKNRRLDLTCRLAERLGLVDQHSGEPSLEDLENVLSLGTDCFEIQREAAGTFLWIRNPEGGEGEGLNLALILAVLQGMLLNTGDPRVLLGTSADTCDRPRAGEFGGGWWAVSAETIRSGNTWDAALEAERAIHQKRKIDQNNHDRTKAVEAGRRAHQAT